MTLGVIESSLRRGLIPVQTITNLEIVSMNSNMQPTPKWIVDATRVYVDHIKANLMQVPTDEARAVQIGFWSRELCILLAATSVQPFVEHVGDGDKDTIALSRVLAKVCVDWVMKDTEDMDDET